VGDYSCPSESDQASGEVCLLWLGSQPDGQSSRSDMVDAAAPASSRRDTVVNQALVRRQIWAVTTPVLSGHEPAASGSSGTAASLSMLTLPGGCKTQVRACLMWSLLMLAS
jgi:hypothetical protein